MLPVPTLSFYGPRTESPDPVDSAGWDQPGPACCKYLCACSTHYTWVSNLSKCISHVKSSHHVTLKQLLGTVIDINPFMVPCSKISDKWKEVTMIMQAKRSCQNWEPETLINKVSSLLAWVEVHDHFLSHSPHTDNYSYREGRRKGLSCLLAGSSTVIQQALLCSQGS